MVERKNWKRPASSGEGEIFSQMWCGDKQRAVVQIAHGMAEHSERYDHFASFLAGHGYVVCMNDHAGHGPHAEVKGHFADEDGWEHVVRDMKNLMDEVAGQHAGLPVFLMGHSMGSFLSRSYITRYNGLDGCILSGTMGKNGALGLGKLFASIIKATRGKKHTSPFLQKLSTGGFNKRIQDPISENAWLSTVDEVVAAYDADAHCGFAFTAGGYYDLFTGMQEVTAPQWAANVPDDLPIYLFAGDEDPVGNYGEGPQMVYDALKNTGQADVQIKLYPGKRHEMINESNRDEVYQDVLDWLEAHGR